MTSGLTKSRVWACNIVGVCTIAENPGKSIKIYVVPNAHLYDYKDLTDLTREELFVWIAIDQVLEQFTGVDLAAAGAVLSGQPFIPTRKKFAGATPNTSVASIVSRRVLNKNLSFRLPMITGKTVLSLKIAFTNNLGAFVGRSVPLVGWLILAYDAEEIMRKTIIKYDGIAIGEDKIL